LDTTPEWEEALEAWVGIQSAPAKENRRRSKGFAVLATRFLEKWFATSHWLMPGVWFVPVICISLYTAIVTEALALPLVGGLFIGGVLAWTFVEYWLHRWFFHLPPGTHPFRRYILFIAHGYHHEFPNDPGRLVAPPVLSWPIAVFLVVLYSTLLGSWWTPFFAGTVTGYLGYDWMHYYTHHGRPKSGWLKRMRKFHLDHHFKDHESRFGLSTPLWDFVLGTMGTEKSHETALDENRNRDSWA
jgi:hypothetical protein